MENSKNKKSRIGEIIIILLVLICTALVLAEMTTNLVAELNSQASQLLILSAGILTPNARSTYPHDYTSISLN